MADPPVQPSDMPIAAAVAQHAGVTQSITLPDVKVSSEPPPPEASMTEGAGGSEEPDYAPEDTRREYGEALSSGAVSGPIEFSQGYAGKTLGALRDPNAPAKTQNNEVVQATAAAKKLVTQLPTHEDFIDHAIAITDTEGLPATAAYVAVTKQNMVDHWADTGQTPTEQYKRAMEDEDFRQELTDPKPEPPQFPAEPTEPKELSPTEMRWIGDPEATGAAETSKAMAPAVEAHFNSIMSDLAAKAAKSDGLWAKTLNPDGTVNKEAFHREFVHEAEDPEQLKEAMDVAMSFGINSVASVAIQRMFMTPEQIASKTLSKEAQHYAQATVRSATGNSVREQEVAKAALEQYRKALNPHMDDYEKWIAQGPTRDYTNIPVVQHLVDYVEGRSTGSALHPSAAPLQPLADAMRSIYEEVKGAIQAEIPDISSFIEDYYRHMWKDTRSLWDVIRSAGRMGSGASLNKRTIPTLTEGIQRGLIPKILDPIDNTLHYVQGMRDYLAQHHVIELGKAQGYVIPSIAPPGPGMSRLKGRGAEVPVGPGMTQHLYAPSGYARAYNSWVGKGFYEWPLAGAVYDKFLFAANMMTGLKLALSGYHAWNIAQEAIVAELAKDVGKIARGDIVGAIKDIGLSPATVPGRILASALNRSPVRIGHARVGYVTIPSLADKFPGRVSLGAKMQQQYLRTHDYGPEMEGIVQALTDAGARFLGRGREYRVGMSKDFFQAWQRGSILRELRQDIRSVMGDASEHIGYRRIMAPGRAVSVAAQEIGRFMDTVLAPLFDTAIPRIKVAAAADELEAWVAGHPNATIEARDEFARKLVDSMDNRFGEMVQDNLFWPRVVKQVMNVATVSVGWEYGSLRAFGLAGKDVMQKDVMALRARWVLGFTMMTAIQSSVYQYLKTGTAPQGKEWITPSTGGKTTGAKGVAPEREMTLLPGYTKDALAIYNSIAKVLEPSNPLVALHEYAAGKASPLVRTIDAFGTGEKEFGQSVASRLHETASGGEGDWFDKIRWGIGDYAKLVLNEVTPINIENPRYVGSRLTEPERFLGLRPAPGWWNEPKMTAGGIAGHEKLLKSLESGREKRFYERQGLPVPSHRDNGTATPPPSSAPGFNANKLLQNLKKSHP